MSGAASVLQALSEPFADGLAVDGPGLLGQRAATHGLSAAGSTSCGGNTRFVRTKDGAVALNLSRPSDVDLLGAVIGRRPGDDPWVDAHQGFGSLTQAQVTTRAAELGLACAGIGEQLTTPGHGAVTSVTPWEFAHVGSAPGRARRDEPPRVLDLSSLWAGPLAGALLAAAGAEVIKVEHPDRPDGTRRGPAAFFSLLNDRKREVALDLARTQDRRQFIRLLDWADVVIDNLRPRALEQLGLEPRALVAGRDSLAWLSITGYTRRGRDRNRVAFGDDAAVAGGLVVRDPSSGDPLFCGDAVADPITGLHAAVALLAAHAAGGAWHVSSTLSSTVAHVVDHFGGRGHPPYEPVILDVERGALPRPRADAWESRTPQTSAVADSVR